MVLPLPDMKTASYCPQPAATIRFFNCFSDGRTSNAGGSACTRIRICGQQMLFNTKEICSKQENKWVVGDNCKEAIQNYPECSVSANQFNHISDG
uniref:Uncharacterized protein MANES_01G176400 n=1 Tax=Rhizophora mucronata TaxID=61149 RepID=A0A2P2KND7_RHIMU